MTVPSSSYLEMTGPRTLHSQRVELEVRERLKVSPTSQYRFARPLKEPYTSSFRLSDGDKCVLDCTETRSFPVQDQQICYVLADF